MVLNLEDHYIVLAMCILSPTYITPEKAYACYTHNIPLVTNKYPKWITESIVDEMRTFRKKGMKLAEIGELYGMDCHNVHKYIRGKLRTIEHPYIKKAVSSVKTV